MSYYCSSVFLIVRRPPRSTRTDTLVPYTTLFRSAVGGPVVADVLAFRLSADYRVEDFFVAFGSYEARRKGISDATRIIKDPGDQRALTLRSKLLFTPTPDLRTLDRKRKRMNSSH